MPEMYYKDHVAEWDWSPEDNCYVGHLVGIRATYGFHADTIPELQVAFEDAVDDYIDFMSKRGETR